MRLLERSNTGDFSLTKNLVGDNIPQYAILSHTWGGDTEEVTFKNLIDGTDKRKAGYNKIRFCGEKAAGHGLQYFWVDTCCIDKSNSTELQEAINSMFHWYRNAAKCYVYLSDVSSPVFSQLPCESAFRASRWFTRGWTLQELLAPRSVEFFSREGNRLGDKTSLERQIHEITGIAVPALRGAPLFQFGADKRLSWAENRQTTREEDKAYSLLGIFDFHMPLIYGEGRENAFKRLREEIDKPSKALDRLPYAVEAPFNSYAKQHSPSCLPDTRVELLRDVYDWADRQDECCIFWLNGLAGTGKSTIARTVAWKWNEEGRLGASFFFSQGGGDVGHAGKFIASIAVQLASSVPTLHRFICDAITGHRDIASLSLRDQWRLLVLGPLLRLDGNSYHASYVLVLDALDECDDDNNIRIILQLLAEARSLKIVQLRIFLTSRREVPIRHGFYLMSETKYRDFVLHNISPSTIDHDISNFLEYHLRLIGEEYSLDAGWPGAKVIKALVQSASGLFIWAATACRFVREGLFADERLSTLLKGEAFAATATTPEEHLHGIYLTVLRNSIQPGFSQQDKEKFYSLLRDILGSLVTIFSPLSVDSLSRLLAIQRQRVERMLRDLHAVLDIPKDLTRLLRLHHPSFRDFLLDRKRCGDPNFWVDQKQVHRTLAARCIQLMSASLREDICGVGRPGALVADIESSRIQRCLPPEVQYACLYWIQHLQRSGTPLQDDDQVHQFLREHLLHWLEALCWMRRVSEGIHAITLLVSIALASQCSDLQAFIHDIERFALSSQAGIGQAPLQTYYSALIFAPLTSIVRNQFKDRMLQWRGRLPRVEEHWNALLQTLEGHSHPVNAVAFSPDGQLLASASFDLTVRLWSPASGVEVMKLEGHSHPVNAVAFSPDGQQLASASYDGTVRLWNLASGEEVKKLGHSDAVMAVAFSPGGQLLASALYNGTVRLWSPASGVEVKKLEGHSRLVNAVAFSPDGQQLASASYDGTVRLWNPASGAEVKKLRHSDAVMAVAFSPDGQLLASASYDRTVRLWSPASGVEVKKLEGHSRLVNAVAFSPDGQQLASASLDRTVRLWNPASGAEVKKLGYGYATTAVAFSPDGQQLASASVYGTVRLWNPASAVEVKKFGHNETVTAVAFSPDGQLLASASKDRTVRLWNPASGAEVKKLEGHSRSVNAVTFSSDGQQLASASDDGTVRLWDAASGEEIRKLVGHSGTATAVAFSPDGKQLAASFDGIVRLRDAATGEEVKKIILQTRISSLHFSSDSQRLETDRGTLTISSSSPSLVPFLQRPSDHIFLNDKWIARNGQNFLWLPYNYRGRCSALRGNLLVIGQASGVVSFFQFT